MFDKKIQKYECKYLDTNNEIKRNIYIQKINYYKKLNGGMNNSNNDINDDLLNKMINIRTENETKLNDIGKYKWKVEEEFESVKNFSNQSKIDPYLLLSQSHNETKLTREHIIPKNALFFIPEKKNSAFYYLFTNDINMIIFSEEKIQHFKGESFFSDSKNDNSINIDEQRKKIIENHKLGLNRNGDYSKISGDCQRQEIVCYQSSIINYPMEITDFTSFYIIKKLSANQNWDLFDNMCNSKNKTVDLNLANMAFQNFEYLIDKNNDTVFFLADPRIFIRPKHIGLKVIVALAYLYFHITYKLRMNDIIDQNLYNYMLKPEMYVNWLLPDELSDEKKIGEVMEIYNYICSNRIFHLVKNTTDEATVAASSATNIFKEPCNTNLALKNPFLVFIEYILKKQPNQEELEKLRNTCKKFINDIFLPITSIASISTVMAVPPTISNDVSRLQELEKKKKEGNILWGENNELKKLKSELQK